MKFKICGMKHNVEEVASLRPDYLGFIFWEKSSRHFENIISDLPENIKKIGVFVDAPYEEIIATVSKYNLQGVQLHGNESPQLCLQLKKEKLEVIKVFSIKDDFDFSVLQPYEEVCDFYLFDTKGKLPGGNGYTFDWNVLNKYPSEKPFFLSGGIGLEEVEKIKAILKSDLPVYAIDVNSRFEIKPGLKNTEDLKQFKKLVFLN
ncbi:phosphoribosylanthranilate isomerase [Flavobacteriaceae bacterium R38]|nr:phosphoribosylanthranilate isomerase [Flavobacteriaceae bacterium R38]